MSGDIMEGAINLIKLPVLFLIIVIMVPALVWAERRASAFIQNRLGPNRVGPLGITQLVADAIKFFFKEEFIPGHGRRFLFYFAPVMGLLPIALAWAAIPLSTPLQLPSFELFGSDWGPYRIPIQGYEIGVGIVFVLGVSSLATYSTLLAGWASSSKYALYGALRACAQMISYELALGLALVGILLIYNTFNFNTIIDAQSGPLTFAFFGEEKIISFLPNWGIFYQPLGAYLFFVSVLAESHRAPFDLPEAEGELVAGFHTEYGGFKMNMFYIAEYGHVVVASALLATFYFGGYNLPWVTSSEITSFLGSFIANELVAHAFTVALLFGVLFAKIFFFIWIFMWVRWTLPRFRFDQLMDLGWKTLLPWALANTVLTAICILVMRGGW